MNSVSVRTVDNRLNIKMLGLGITQKSTTPILCHILATEIAVKGRKNPLCQRVIGYGLSVIKCSNVWTLYKDRYYVVTCNTAWLQITGAFTFSFIIHLWVP